jgi:hypothetical protein
MTRFRGTPQAYEATRALQSYHPGQPELPDLAGGMLDARQKRHADRIGSWILVEEGRLALSEKRYGQAVSLFEEARAWGKLNRSAMDGIRAALQSQYKDGKDPEGALVALKAYFPNAPDPVSGTIPGFGLPRVTPPTMAPLVEPGPPIEEQDDTSGLHDFERKEMELAPQDQEEGNGAPAPEPERSDEARAPEGEPNARNEMAVPLPEPSARAGRASGAPAAPQPAGTLPGEKPSAGAAPAVKAPAAQAPQARSPAAPELGVPHTPSAPRRPAQRRAVRRLPAQAEMRLPRDPAAEAEPTAAAPAGTAARTAAHLAPQSLPPGFALADGVGTVAAHAAPGAPAAQNPPPLPGLRAMKRGLWPAEDSTAVRAQPPMPPPLLSELSEGPPSAAKP